MKLNFTKAILCCTLFFSVQIVSAKNPAQLNVSRNVLARSYTLSAKVTTKDYLAGVVIVLQIVLLFQVCKMLLQN